MHFRLQVKAGNSLSFIAVGMVRYIKGRMGSIKCQTVMAFLRATPGQHTRGTANKTAPNLFGERFLNVSDVSSLYNTL